MSSCGATNQSPQVISDYNILFKPIKTSKYDTCDTIKQADKQACLYYGLHGTKEQKEKCSKKYIYQDVYSIVFFPVGEGFERGKVYTGCSVTTQ